MNNFISFALPSIEEAEINEVVQTLKSGWLTTGPQTRRFEADFSEFLGRKYSLAVNSATAGLHLALEAVGVTEGDVVITTIYTFTATAEVIRYLNATPVFIDVNKKTKNMDIDCLKKALDQYRGRVKVIIPVHFAGLACEMAEIFECAKENNAVVIEDAAHALPTTYDGKLIGSFGDITVFSFYATKTLATGEGGMIVTDNDAWAERIKTMRLHGINRDVFDRYSSSKPSWYYEIVAPGFKYNLTDVASSIGIHQLKRLNAMQQRRAEIASVYQSAFVDMPLELPYFELNEIHSWHLFTVELITEKLSITRDDFISALVAAGVGVSVHFIPLHRQPYWRESCSLVDSDFPVATDKYTRTLSLPIYSSLSSDQVNYIAETVRSICLQHLK